MEAEMGRGIVSYDGGLHQYDTPRLTWTSNPPVQHGCPVGISTFPWKSVSKHHTHLPFTRSPSGLLGLHSSYINTATPQTLRFIHTWYLAE